MSVRCGQIGLGAIALVAVAGCSRNAMLKDPFPPVTSAQIHSPIPAEGIRKDLEELFALVESTTPRPYLRVDREKVRAEFDRCVASVNRPMSRREVLGLIEDAYASYAIAHLYVMTPYEDFNAWSAAGGRVLSIPLRVEAADPETPAQRRLVVASDWEGLSAGEEVVRINGRDVQQLLATMARRSSSETEAYRTRQMTAGLVDRLWSMGLEAPYVVELASGRTVNDGGQVPPRRVSVFARRDGRGRGVPARTDFELRWVEPDIALIRWTAMDPRRSAEWEAFLTASFAEIVGRPAAGVIIDIRDNGGGSSPLANALFGHVTAEPYRFAGGKLWRKSAAYDRFLESVVVWWARGLPWRRSFSAEYAAMRVGEERSLSPDAPRPAARRPPTFDGPVALLIGPGTFSSGTMVADAAVTYGLMPVFGSPTGGVPNTHGEIGFHRLANSGLIVSFCSALFLRASGDEQDTGPVAPTLTTGGRGMRHGQPFDEDLAAAVRWIRSGNRPPSP